VIEKEILVESIRVTRSRDLGNLDELSESIATRGLSHPLVITPGGVLLTGTRRLAAVKYLGWPTVPVVQVDVLADALAELTLERADPVAAKAMNTEETAALINVLLEFYQAEYLVFRRERGAKLGQKYAEGETGFRSSKAIPAALGMSTASYTRLRSLAAAKYHPDPTIRKEAIKQIAAVDGGQRALSTAWDKVRELLPPPMQVAPLEASAPDHVYAITGAARQVRACESASTTLRAVTNGLDRIRELDDGLSDDQIDAILADLANARRLTEKTIANLRRMKTERNNKT
jgi:hypothetical protein